MKNKGIVAGNWKMFKTPSEGSKFVEEFNKLMLELDGVEVIFCPPFSALFNIDAKLKNTPYKLGSQNCHWETEGAFTGEISIPMLIDCGVDYVILGHSERRHIFNESDEWINNKVKAVLKYELDPILCIGETFEQRKKNETKKVLTQQLSDGLRGVQNIDKVIVAYEPVWAIGTGETASNAQVEEAHNWVRNIITDLYSKNIAENTAILYGGSVKPDNAEGLFEIEGVDGFLIGGASLKINSFSEIILKVNNILKG